MPRNMSFALTTSQFRKRTKTVTRRLGWDFLRPGDVVMGVEKGMGLKKGEKVKRLGLIRVLANTPERLASITDDDVVREGFPDLGRAGFITMFCEHNGITPADPVNRIEYEYID